MKKILSIALAFCMMLSVCVVFIGAADGTTVDFVMGDAVVEAGTTTVTVDLNVTNNPGFAFGGFYYQYDETVMTLTSVALVPTGTSLSLNTVMGRNNNLDYDCDAYSVLEESVGENWCGTGAFLTLTFTLNEGVVGTYPVIVELIEDDPLVSWTEDWDLDLPAYTVDGEGSITVEEAAPAYAFLGSNIALGDKFAINVKYDADLVKGDITVTSEGKDVDFTDADGQVTIANIDAKNIDKVYDVTINGFTESFSVAAYCEAQADSTDAELAAVAAAVLDYNKAANNYFEGTGETIDVPHCDVGTDNPRVVANAAEGPTFYSVRLQLNDGVYVVVRMENYTEGDTVTVTIGDVAAGYTIGDVNGMAGIFIPVRADQYDADIVITAGNSTLTYSVNTYIQQKQNSSDADLVNLVNALGHYGQAVAAYTAA